MDDSLTHTLHRAVEFHRLGDVASARELYSAVLKVQPANADALHLLGVIHRDEGDFAKARQLISAAVKAQPREPAFLCTLAGLLLDLNLTAEAREVLGSALQIQADYPEAVFLRALAEHKDGAIDAALADYDAVLNLNPKFAQAHANKGILLQLRGELRAAKSSYLMAIQIDESQAAFHANLAAVLVQLKDYSAALVSSDRAIALRGNYAEAYSHQGDAHLGLQAHADALACFDRAIHVNEQYAPAHCGRGIALQKLARLDDALQAYRRAVALKPDFAEAHNNLGDLYFLLGRTQDGLASCDRSLALRPNFVTGYVNRGNLLHAMGRPQEALTSFDKALSLDSSDPDALFNKARVHLSLGEYSLGWPLYEARWDRSEVLHLKRHFDAPQWSGRESLAHKTIFLYAEQGLGDCIQFVRLVPRVVELGARVILQVPKNLQMLLAGFKDYAQIVSFEDPIGSFEYHCSLLSLPLALSLQLSTIPKNVPYVTAFPNRVARWKKVIGERGFKIGIAWQGSRSGIDVGRSFPVTLFHALALIPGVRLISLQKHDGTEQLAGLPSGMTVETLGPDFDSGPDAFLDSSAVISSLDLVITSDSAVAHLAGAMGALVWIVLQKVPDWRWMLSGSKCAWYPTAQLFRQAISSQWEPVFDEMRGSLIQLLKDKGLLERSENGHSTIDSKALPSMTLHGESATSRIARAVSLHTRGDTPGAEAIYHSVRPSEQGYADAQHLLAVIRQQQGRFSEALVFVEKAIQSFGFQPLFYSTRGQILMALGQVKDAVSDYQQSLAACESAGTYWYLANAYHRLGFFEDALVTYDQALKLEPQFPEAYNNRGTTLIALGRSLEALTSFDEAIVQKPDCAEAFCNKADALQQLGRFEEGVQVCEKAIELAPGFSQAWSNRGVCLQAMGHFEAAVDSYRQAVALNANYPEALSNQGAALHQLGQFSQALDCIERALALRPDYAEAQFNAAMVLLTQGDFERGLPLYEARRLRADVRRLLPTWSEPAWDGRASLEAKTLLVYAEQGFGDAIQFVRYLSGLRQAGAAVLLHVPRPLRALFQSLPGVSKVLAQGDVLPAFDYQISLLSLPWVLGTRLDSIPADIPYLYADGDRVARWKARIGAHGFKVGINWQGSRHRVDLGRSFPVSLFEAISQIPGVRLISLQKNDGVEQLNTLPSGMHVETLGADFDAGGQAFLDSAAVIQNLDLVITSDTALAHLAGALAAPVWLVLKAIPDWRWLAQGETTPWYPSMRIFRQSTAGDWEGVFAKLRESLLVHLHTTRPSSGVSLSFSTLSSVGAPREFELAQAFFLQQQWDAAQALCQKILAQTPSHAAVLHLLGLIYAKRQQLAVAISYIELAVALAPSEPEFLVSLGKLLRDSADPEAALVCFEAAITNNPRFLDGHLQAAQLLENLGRFEAAAIAFGQVISLAPDVVEGYVRRSYCLLKVEKFSDALDSCQQAIALQPEDANLYANAAAVAERMRDWPRAESYCQKGLAIDPSNVGTLFNAGNVAYAKGDYRQALSRFDQLVAIAPDYAQGWCNRGNTLQKLGDLSGSVDSYQQALLLNPQWADAHSNLAFSYYQLGQTERAVFHADRAIEQVSGHAESHIVKAMALLAVGDYLQGWPLYEWRWQRADLRASYRQFAQPRLTVDRPFRGQRIFIYAEQGLGDCIQFARYALWLGQQGAQVIFEVPACLQVLLSGLHPNLMVLARGSDLPAFDTHCPLMSLPAALLPVWDRLPDARLSLTRDLSRTARWQAPLSGADFKIGVVWAGSVSPYHAGRSFPVEQLKAIAGLPGVRLISLQRAEDSRELIGSPVAGMLTCLGAEFDAGPEAFRDSAAILGELDLIITADTAMAHLAGALGVPVWVALKAVPDWRWGLSGEQSAWYPTMRLFRQSVAGQWDWVFTQMQAILRAELSH